MLIETILVGTYENSSHKNFSSLGKNVMLVDYVWAPAVRMNIVTMRDWKNTARGSQIISDKQDTYMGA